MKNFDYPTIVQYIRGELPSEALLAFEAQLTNNVQLVNEVALVRQTIQGIQQSGIRQVSIKLHHLQNTLTTEGFFFDEGDIVQYLEDIAPS